MEIASSARRHGVSDGSIRRAIANAIRVIESDDGFLVIGPGTSGQLLELLARPT